MTYFSVQIFDFDKSFDDIKIERDLNNLNTKIADVSTTSLSHEEIEKGQEEDLNYKQDKCNNVMSLGVNQKVNKELKVSCYLLIFIRKIRSKKIIFY